MAQQWYCSFSSERHPKQTLGILLFIALRRRRRYGRSALFLLVSDQPNLIHAEFSYLINDANDVAITDSNAALDIDDAILLVLNLLEQPIDFFCQLFSLQTLLCEVILTI